MKAGLMPDLRELCVNPDEGRAAYWDPSQLRDRGMPDGWMTWDDFTLQVIDRCEARPGESISLLPDKDERGS